MTTDYVYALFYIFEGKKNYFYVGRSINPKRRMQEHRSDARNDKTEDSREFIRNLWAVGLDFDHEILYETDEETEFVEDYFICKLRNEGYELTNMKKGDDSIYSRDYAGPEEYLAAKRKLIAEAKQPKVKVERVRDLEDTDRTTFYGENPETKFVSEGLKEILERRKK